MVANILTRRVMSVFVATVVLVLLGLGSVTVNGPFAQTSAEDFQHDQFEEEEVTPAEEPAYGGEFEEEQLTTTGSEEEEDLDQEPAPLLPKDFSTPESLHFPEQLFEEHSNTSSVPVMPYEEPIEDAPTPMSSAPPTLPAAHTLPPHEQLAIHCVESGVEALARDDFERAQEHLERALEVAPMQPFGYYFLGRLAFARGEHKTALVFLRKADALFARGDQTWRGEAARLRGAVYEDMQDYRRAHAAYRQSLQLTPTNLRAASALARLASEELDTSVAVSR